MLKDSLEVRGQRGFFTQEQEATERAGEPTTSRLLFQRHSDEIADEESP